MKRLFILVPILALQGCAVVYTVASTATYVLTDKAPADHVSSTLAQADCNAVHVVTKGTYYCEERNIGKTYNRQYP